MNRVRLAFSLLLACGLSVVATAQGERGARAMTAAAAVDAVRFTSTPDAVQLRVEVFSASGVVLYDSDWKNGNVFDWIVGDGLGHPLPYGSYRLRIRSKDLEGLTSEKETTLHVAADRVAIDDAPGRDLKMTTTAHDGETGQLVTTSGDLSFRFGDFLNRKDTEVMRLTAEGNLGIGTDKPQARLDVNGLIRTSEGIQFADGSVLSSAEAPSIMRTRPSRSEPASNTSVNRFTPGSNVSGTGTPNQVTKWLDGLGTVGDSTMTEVGGKVGIGTTSPGGNLHIYGAAGADLFAGMGPDVLSGPGFNFGYAGNSFGIGAGFFNIRPAAAATGVNPSLRFMTVDQERMIITKAGDVGIATSAPAAKLHVVGAPGQYVQTGNGGNAPDAMQIIGGYGGGSNADGGNGGNGGGVLIQGGIGAYGGFMGARGAGGQITLQPGIPRGRVVMANDSGTGVGIGGPTFWVPGFFKLQVNGDVLLGNPNPISFSSIAPRLMVNTPNAVGLRVETGAGGDKLASFGGLGRFEVDAPGVAGGRLEVTEAGNTGIGTNVPQQMLSVNGSANIDQSDTNNGMVSASALTFGSSSGEGIASKRSAGGNQFGLDFYTASTSRMTIANAGGVTINGDLTVTGTLRKGGGFFKIDHPLDPENKYLYHSFVESPDMKNMYDGIVSLDKNGEATVELPDWFEALNRDFRYQLTCIGGFAPVYIADEISTNRFRIAGGKPGMKVSWTVTGIRHDRFANEHRVPVEEDKAAAQKGD